jgi:hypothetical protein
MIVPVKEISSEDKKLNALNNEARLKKEARDLRDAEIASKIRNPS